MNEETDGRPGDTAVLDVEPLDPALHERRLRADAVRNRQRVLEAAAEVFAERGLDATLDDVAEAAGVGVGTVYRRFANKEALLDALFERKVDAMVELGQEAAAFDDPWAGFVHFVERALEWQACNRGLRQVLLHSDFACAGAERAREALTPILAEIISRAQVAGKMRPDVVVNDIPVLFTMIGAASDYLGSGDLDVWRRYAALLVDGLVAGRAGHSPLHDPPPQAVIDAAMSSCH